MLLSSANLGLRIKLPSAKSPRQVAQLAGFLYPALSPALSSSMPRPGMGAVAREEAVGALQGRWDAGFLCRPRSE